MSIPRRVRERNRLDIIAEILLIAQTPALKTQIMYRANLSFRQLHDYLSILTDIGAIETIKDENGEPKAYKTTEKGLRYLKAYNDIREILRRQQPGTSAVTVLASSPKRRQKNR